MSDGSLLLLMLLVSWTSLTLQSVAAVYLWSHRNSPGRIAGRGYLRTASWRIFVACLYVTAAMLQMLNIQVPGAGGLSAESLFIFTIVQAVWLTNSFADMRIRRRLAEHTTPDSTCQEGGPTSSA